MGVISLKKILHWELVLSYLDAVDFLYCKTAEIDIIQKHGISDKDVWLTVTHVEKCFRRGLRERAVINPTTDAEFRSYLGPSPQNV